MSDGTQRRRRCWDPPDSASPGGAAPIPAPAAAPPPVPLRDLLAGSTFWRGEHIFSAAFNPFVKDCMREAFPADPAADPEDKAHADAAAALGALRARVLELEGVTLPAAVAEVTAATAALAAAGSGAAEKRAASEARGRLDGKTGVRKQVEKARKDADAVSKRATLPGNIAARARHDISPPPHQPTHPRVRSASRPPRPPRRRDGSGSAASGLAGA